MRANYYVAAVMLAGSLIAPSSAAAQDREQLQMLAELRMIQEQSGQLRALIAGLEASITALTAKLDQQSNDTRKGFADQRLQIDGLRDGVSVVREKIDDTNVRISTLTHEVETLRATIATQPQPAAPPDPGAPAGDPSSPATPPAPAPSTPAGPPGGMSAERLFDTAMNDYLGGDYQLAVAGFEAYLRTYATAPNAAQAQYYIGEALFQLTRYQEAVTAYGRVIQTYPGSTWVAEAYYKQGLSFERLKELDRARQAYDAVIKSFPDSNAAVLARQRLEALPR
ncbi:MAG: tol-pal system protein YbgF [Acidobacteriota bacterium]|nr:tol-pal system protein YbgF [Acidobacteriota bacterium]